MHEVLTYFPRFGAFENLHGHPEPPLLLYCDCQGYLLSLHCIGALDHSSPAFKNILRRNETYVVVFLDNDSFYNDDDDDGDDDNIASQVMPCI